MTHSTANRGDEEEPYKNYLNVLSSSSSSKKKTMVFLPWWQVEYVPNFQHSGWRCHRMPGYLGAGTQRQTRIKLKLPSFSITKNVGTEVLPPVPDLHPELHQTLKYLSPTSTPRSPLTNRFLRASRQDGVHVRVELCPHKSICSSPNTPGASGCDLLWKYVHCRCN